ncbi:MAG: trypsin-like serine protease, partial [Labilithrix sp.]|nr:trypsin-like serine protease [Labilithrix sp.]
NDAVSCSDKFGKSVQPNALFVTTEPNLFRAKNYYAATEIITPTATNFCGNDIAIVILEQNIPDSEAEPATPVVQFKMTDESKIGGTVTAMGYGITSPTANDSGQRRIRENIGILCIPGSPTLECEGQLARFSDSPAEFITEGYVCSGDSGGGAFDQKSFTNGSPYVLGALSRGPQTESKCLAAIYSRTDAHADMIIEAGNKAAEQGGYPAPNWTKPLNADGSEPTADEPCEGDICTDTSATEPAPATTTTTTTTGCSSAPAGTSGNPTALVALAAAALLVGAISQKLEEPLLPVKGILLEALAEAREAAREREARAAMAHALVRIREASAVGLGPTAAPSPELWLLHPTRVLTVNAAGYLQERAAELPAGIFDVAFGEPYATLRTSVLRALEVRRADLRPLLAWLDQRDAIFATVIAESDDPDGLLVVPAGARAEELTLEEARAAKLLADAFVAVSQATSARERHLGRERELQRRVDALDDEGARLRHTIELEVGRHALAATRLARPATVGIYSAAARMAYEALERRIAQEAPTVLVARAGIDPVPYVARAHLSGPRRSGPLVVVDGTSSREHDVERWNDGRASPLALADRGLLLLVDGAALPREVQVVVARAVAERRAPWERASPLDVAVALSATKTLEELTESGLLAPELAARFDGGEPIVFPGLRDRSEDLRAIVADRLAREGLRVHGRPTGIDAGAFARLVEHPFEGEDAELASIVTRLVARAQGDVVRAADVDALGLRSREEEAEPPRWPEGARAANRAGD